MYRLCCQVLIYRRIARVDIADQVKEILAGVQTKGMLRLSRRLVFDYPLRDIVLTYPAAPCTS